MPIIQRHRSPVTITTVPRNSIAHTRHKEIDAILKNLRLCSRHLKTALDSFSDELRLLERLYYKCKNQHRTALFFKRVPEMRRYGRRLCSLDIVGLVHLLRASFVSPVDASDHKTLKGSWGHVPTEPYICFLKERLTSCATLVSKVRSKDGVVLFPTQPSQMRRHLQKAYHHFSLAMQSGAFVQLIILFVAMSSRMSMLSSELEETLQLGILTCNSLLAIIHPAGSHVTTSPQLLSENVISSPSHADSGIPTEDMGQPVFYDVPIDTSKIVVEDLSVKLEPVLDMRAAPPPGYPAFASDCTHAQVSKRVAAKVAQRPRVKKARKKVDEIDEIFGF